MALRGNLHDFSVTQLFNLVNLAGKTGMLAVENSSKTARVYFKEGRLILAEMDSPEQENTLTNLLLRAGKIKAEQAKDVEARAHSHTDKELGLLLINSGYCNQRDIIQVVKSRILNSVYPLFTWSKGSFFFDANVSPPEEQITVTLNLENVIIEGTRWIEEWSQLQDELPSLDVAVKFVDQPDVRLRNVQLSPDEWRVISYVSPKNTVRQIGKACGMDEFQIRKTVFRLLQAGLVEIVRVRRVEPQLPTAAPPAAGQNQSTKSPLPQNVDRGLLTRLIHKIRSIGE